MNKTIEERAKELWHMAMTYAINICTRISNDFNNEDKTEEAAAAHTCRVELIADLGDPHPDFISAIEGATEAQDDWKRVEEIRKAFAEYRATEGCSCCQDIDGHKEAEKKLAELFRPKPYDDLSGWDWNLPTPPSNDKKESA